MSAQRHEKWGGGIVKQASDLYTRDLIDKPKRGRPRKPDAMTDAQRAREYRARKRAAQPAPAVTEIPAQRYQAVADRPDAPWPRVVDTVTEKGPYLWPWGRKEAWHQDPANDVTGADRLTAYERAALGK